MDEMYRTHKEPVWGWIGVVAEMIATARQARRARPAAASRNSSASREIVRPSVRRPA
jgi:hypothetical protein